MVGGFSGLVLGAFIYALFVWVAFAGLTAILLGITFLRNQARRKSGFFLIVVGFFGVLPFVVFRAINAPPAPKESAVTINLAEPLDKRGIPATAKWMDDYHYSHTSNRLCFVKGKVALTVICPDGKKIEETARSVIADYNANGFHRIHIDGFGDFTQQQAIARFREEVSKWSQDAANTNQIATQQQGAEKWLLGKATMSGGYFSSIEFQQRKYSVSSQAVSRAPLKRGHYTWRYQIELEQNRRKAR